MTFLSFTLIILAATVFYLNAHYRSAAPVPLIMSLSGEGCSSFDFVEKESETMHATADNCHCDTCQLWGGVLGLSGQLTQQSPVLLNLLLSIPTYTSPYRGVNEVQEVPLPLVVVKQRRCLGLYGYPPLSLHLQLVQHLFVLLCLRYRTCLLVTPSVKMTWISFNICNTKKCELLTGAPWRVWEVLSGLQQQE